MKIMGRATILIVIATAMVLTTFSGGAKGTVFRVENNCDETVWPGILPGNTSSEDGEQGGFTLKRGEWKELHPPPNWSGRLWGRTGCKFDSGGQGSCETGDCGNVLQCNGAGGNPPVTLVELTLRDVRDFYDVSMVDGYNLPVSVVAVHGTGNCTAAGACNGDLRESCPSELAVEAGGKVVACQSACEKFNSSEYCCTGAHANPNTCQPTQYSRIFKKVCPTAYSYAYDDASSIFTCTGPDYTITFCPTNKSGKRHGSANETSGTNGETIVTQNTRVSFICIFFLFFIDFLY
ncbi:pathogenesis-related thaumatin-like protein 3.5 [Cryptomeria japonica]|uniref:pathogenesis-related thaumatin-like protein 3.5 n=1 Tax=Cryptomeria japonica TaxID=3369 RepID=UPI0025AD4B34|nr:pathogenesis-related thaumatin-like protein 3.5 [Cryptomeria japonica]